MFGREFWVSTVAEFERSKLTQEAFAERRGVAVTTLRSGIYKYGGKAAVSLVPLRVIASTAPTAREAEAANTQTEGIRRWPFTTWRSSATTSTP